MPRAILVLLVVTTSLQAQTGATRIAPSKGWLNDLDKAKAVAAKTGKPIMLVFRCDP